MSEAITDGSTSTIGFGEKPNHPVKFEDCEPQGGHCWAGNGNILCGDPPHLPEICKHCGATRRAIPQASVRYTEPEPPA